MLECKNMTLSRYLSVSVHMFVQLIRSLSDVKITLWLDDVRYATPD